MSLRERRQIQTRLPLRAACVLFVLWLLLPASIAPILHAAITVDPNNVGANSTIPTYDGSDPWNHGSETVYVGGLGNAEIRVDGGSDVIAGATSFGLAHQGGFATITVQGAGSSWTDTSNTSPSLGMGGYGDVTFNVLDGGSLETAGGHVEASSFETHIGHAVVNISGANSNWENKGGDVELAASPIGGADVA
jgi:T5SS/PEP-CTERM-associated repeat protein